MGPLYMVQLCQKLFNVELLEEDEGLLAGACSNWLHQALEHCTALLMRKPACQKIWLKLLNLKHLIFPEEVKALSSKQMPMSVHPELLTSENCQELASQIIKDYIHHVPRYLSTATENHNLWLILRGLLGVLIIGACLFVVAWRYSAIQLPGIRRISENTFPHERILKRNLQRVLYETKHLSVVPVTNPALLQCGCPALGLKIDARRLCHIKGILVRPRDNPADADNLQTLAKLQKFFQDSGHYRVVISLDLDWSEEEAPVRKAPPTPPTRTSAIPIHKPTRRIGIRRRP